MKKLLKLTALVIGLVLAIGFVSCNNGNDAKSDTVDVTVKPGVDDPPKITDCYTVEAVEGNVTYEAAPGEFKKVQVGQELSASTVIKTGLNSSVDINFEGKKITIKAKQIGTVEELYVAAAPTNS